MDDLETAVTGGVLVALGILWKMVITRAKECEVKHEKAQTGLLNVTREVGELKGRVYIAEQLAPKLDELTEAIKKIP